MNGISALIEKSPERPLPFYHARTQQEGSRLRTRKQALIDSKFVGTLILDFPTSEMVKNKFMLFVSYPICGIFVIIA